MRSTSHNLAFADSQEPAPQSAKRQDPMNTPFAVQAQIEQLRAEACDISAHLPIAAVINELDGLKGRAAGESMPAVMARMLRDAPAQFGADTVGAYAKLLVLTLIADSEQRLNRIPIADSIKTVYPAKFANILGGINEFSHALYIEPGSSFSRDLRIASQLSVPLGGSRYIDRSSYLNHNFYRHLGKKRDLDCLRFLITRLKGFGPLFRVHIDERDITDFNSEGWDASYLRVAEMFHLYPKVKGLVGSSWTLDPQLDAISPALSFSRRQFVAHGAFLRDDGPGEVHTEHALTKSKTRRRFYDEGKYIPHCYTFVWERGDLLKWAANATKSTPL